MRGHRSVTVWRTGAGEKAGASARVQVPQSRRQVVRQVDLLIHPVEEGVVVGYGERVELEGGEDRRDRRCGGGERLGRVLRLLVEAQLFDVVERIAQLGVRVAVGERG